MYLTTLKEMLGENRNSFLFPCIIDLVSNGIDLKRFAEEEHTPTRQDVTQFMIAWFKYIGMSPLECQQWMIDYCTEVLSAISSSSKSKIRHSSKSNIKFVYSSNLTLDCGCEENKFKASCEQTCPVYEEMFERSKERERKTEQSIQSYSTMGEPTESDNEIKPQRTSIKDEYKDQFEKAMEVVFDQLNKGVSKKEIVNLLNDSGFKTRMGKRWSYSILGNELRKIKRSKGS